LQEKIEIHPSKMALNRRRIKPAVEMTQAAQFLERLFYWDTP